MRSKIKLYFEEMNVPTKYLDLMFSVSPKEIRWLTQSEFESDLKGYIPEVRALLDAKCGSAVETIRLRYLNVLRGESSTPHRGLTPSISSC